MKMNNQGVTYQKFWKILSISETNKLWKGVRKLLGGFLSTVAVSLAQTVSAASQVVVCSSLQRC